MKVAFKKNKLSELKRDGGMNSLRDYKSKHFILQLKRNDKHISQEEPV